jgi:hypothetical protein
MRRRSRVGALVLAGWFGAAACLSSLDERELGNAEGAGQAGAAGAGDPDGAGCDVGETVCADGCVDTQTSLGNCGGCDDECQNGEVCSEGDCVPLCGESQRFCDGACRTIVSDTAHCGECGNACAGGDFCIDGACEAVCPFSICPGAGGGEECADTFSNPSHCGACDVSCSAGSSCVDGACDLVCPTELAECQGGCVDLSSNGDHCGACGNACAAGTPCVGGSCGCRVGLTACEGACVDLSSDGENCGACGEACPSGQVCAGGSCAAGCGGLQECGSDCVDTLTSSVHCGACDSPCAAAQACDGGQCACPSGGDLCGGVCVDTDTDSTNCGACGKGCAPAQHCSGGSCACEGELTACGELCVETDTSGEHCGACNSPCLAGQSCASGRCQCDGGLTPCDGACVDTSASNAHCGACGEACEQNQACTNGSCVGTTGADGCTATPARQLTLTRISVFQAVRVDVMGDGREIAQTSRNTDVVVGRDAVFRVHLVVAQGFTARELSARLTIADDPAGIYFSKKTIRGSSVEASPDNTFQIAVPAASIQATTRYSVEIVECGTPPSGAAVEPRYPASGDIALAARRTGQLKIHIVPMITNGITPVTTEDALVPYRQLMEAMYPVTNVEFMVGASLTVPNGTDWSANLQTLRSRRAADAPAADVYYYGFIQPTATRAQFCASGCNSGIGYVAAASGANGAASRVAMGLAYADSASPLTMAHEIGHTHGRSHAPCNVPGSTDPGFPNVDGSIGVRGYDRRTSAFVDPTSSDIMGFCANQWISDYTYDGLLERIALLNGN